MSECPGKHFITLKEANDYLSRLQESLISEAHKIKDELNNKNICIHVWRQLLINNCIHSIYNLYCSIIQSSSEDKKNILHDLMTTINKGSIEMISQFLLESDNTRH